MHLSHKRTGVWSYSPPPHPTVYLANIRYSDRHNQWTCHTNVQESGHYPPPHIHLFTQLMSRYSDRHNQCTCHTNIQESGHYLPSPHPPVYPANVTSQPMHRSQWRTGVHYSPPSLNVHLTFDRPTWHHSICHLLSSLLSFTRLTSWRLKWSTQPGPFPLSCGWMPDISQHDVKATVTTNVHVWMTYFKASGSPTSPTHTHLCHTDIKESIFPPPPNTHTFSQAKHMSHCDHHNHYTGHTNAQQSPPPPRISPHSLKHDPVANAMLQ